MCLINIEMGSNRVFNKTIFSDLICKYKNYVIIIEMNNYKRKCIINKNYNYLFKQHISRTSNENNYGEHIYTILINIDNFDVINKSDLLYKTGLYCNKYNECMYKSIESININLVSLKYKYYNNIKLNEFEKLLLIFIEQNINNILKECNEKCVKEVIDVMKELAFQEINGVVVYDHEALDEMMEKERISLEQKLINKQKKLNDKESKLEDKESKLEDKESKLEDKESKLEDKENKLEDKENTYNKNIKEFENKKITLAKELLNIKMPIEKISEITMLSINKIKSL